MSDPNPKGLGGDELAQKGLSSALSNTMIGVVALQGAFKEHCKVITSLGAQAREVRGCVCVCVVVPGCERTYDSSSVIDFNALG